MESPHGLHWKASGFRNLLFLQAPQTIIVNVIFKATSTVKIQSIKYFNLKFGYMYMWFYSYINLDVFLTKTWHAKKAHGNVKKDYLNIGIYWVAQKYGTKNKSVT